MRFDVKNWYRPHLNLITGALLPFSLLYWLITALRRFSYRHHLLPIIRFNVPVIVVGNITVGGTGKTPFVIALVKYLAEKGFHPGIVTRGVGGNLRKRPRIVRHDTLVSDVGDEAILLSRKSSCPVVVGIDRPAAVAELLKSFPECDVVVCDDGLQHYRLARNIEVAIVDGSRLFGNGFLLPSGPLRETRGRLADVDFVVVNSGTLDNASGMKIIPNTPESLAAQSDSKDTSQLLSQRIHAVAGIGNPERFFQTLKSNGYQIIEHVFPDHYSYCKADLEFGDELPVIMTEKDAVKCRDFADNRMWCLPIKAEIDQRLLDKMLSRLQGVKK